MANTYIGIKPETTFEITIGGNTLISLQKLLLHIAEDKTEEELQQAAEYIMKKQYPEEWHEHYAFLVTMIAHIERVAHAKGLTVVEDLDNPTQPGDSLPAQSQ